MRTGWLHAAYPLHTYDSTLLRLHFNAKLQSSGTRLHSRYPYLAAVGSNRQERNLEALLQTTNMLSLAIPTRWRDRNALKLDSHVSSTR